MPSKNTFVFCVCLMAVLYFWAGPAMAQVDVLPLATAISRTQVTARDLGIGDPKLLPDSAWYWVKEVLRNASLGLTFNPEKKIEKLNADASERLYEIKKMADQKKGKLSDKNLESALKKYESDIARITELVLKSKDDDKNKLMKKISTSEFARQQLFDSIERTLRSKTVDTYQQKSLETYAKLLFDQGAQTAGQSLKDFSDQNLKLDSKSVDKTRYFDALKNFFSDPETLSTIDAAKEYALSKIAKELSQLDADEQAQKIAGFLGEETSAATSAATTSKSIIQQIIEEKEKLEQELNN